MADVARARRLAERIKVLIAESLDRVIKNPDLGMVTITDVRVTPDLAHATVFYTVYGSTDELGYRALENPVNVHDLHATILALLGFDHERLTFRHAGRDYRLTDVHGRVVRELIA